MVGGTFSTHTQSCTGESAEALKGAMRLEWPQCGTGFKQAAPLGQLAFDSARPCDEHEPIVALNMCTMHHVVRLHLLPSSCPDNAWVGTSARCAPVVMLPCRCLSAMQPRQLARRSGSQQLTASMTSCGWKRRHNSVHRCVSGPQRQPALSENDWQGREWTPNPSTGQAAVIPAGRYSVRPGVMSVSKCKYSFGWPRPQVHRKQFM